MEIVASGLGIRLGHGSLAHGVQMSVPACAVFVSLCLGTRCKCRRRMNTKFRATLMPLRRRDRWLDTTLAIILAIYLATHLRRTTPPSEQHVVYVPTLKPPTPKPRLHDIVPLPEEVMKDL
jgi:hypothetical protein